jgi:hypothetical protein
VQAMPRVYRAKVKDFMKKEQVMHLIPPQVWNMPWNVNVQAGGGSEKTVRYLSNYVFKAAISDHRIVSVENGQVSFKYQKKGCRRTRTCTITGEEFIRRFLQHTLPTGFMKVRYYGFMNPNSSYDLEEVQALIELSQGFEIETPKTETDDEPPKPLYCPICGGELRYVRSVLPYQMRFKESLQNEQDEDAQNTG